MTEPALRNSRALNRAWFQTCSSAAGQAEDDQSGRPERAAEQGQAEAHDDDADVLDAVVGQQPLEVVLADGEGDPEHARDDAEARTTPPHQAAASGSSDVTRTRP